MRADLKDVIVNTSRYKTGQKKTASLKGLREEQIDALPDKAGMRRNHTDWGFEFRDRIKPLYGFLKKNTGRPWDEVFSEICQHADPRNVRGRHLREHVYSYVSGSGGQEVFSRYFGYRHFYIDDEGILRHNGDRRRHYWKEKLDPNKCRSGDNFYERINGCWFQIWYETVEKSHKAWSYLLNRHQIEYYSDEVRVRQKQLSRKELKTLGLSNDPNFCWWGDKHEQRLSA